MRESPVLFYNVGIIDQAIEKGKQIEYDYVKYGTDKKQNVTSHQRGTPYLLILHNQRYYLMGYSKHWDGMRFHRVDRITNIRVSERAAIPATGPNMRK